MSLKKNFYSGLLLHLLKPLFGSVSWASSSEYFFVLVNNLYIGDLLEANKRQEICIFK